MDWESIQGDGGNIGKAGEMGRAGHRQRTYGWHAAGREVVERKAKEKAAGDLGCQIQASGSMYLGNRTLKTIFKWEISLPVKFLDDNPSIWMEGLKGQ